MGQRPISSRGGLFRLLSVDVGCLPAILALLRGDLQNLLERAGIPGGSARQCVVFQLLDLPLQDALASHHPIDPLLHRSLRRLHLCVGELQLFLGGPELRSRSADFGQVLLAFSACGEDELLAALLDCDCDAANFELLPLELRLQLVQFHLVELLMTTFGTASWLQQHLILFHSSTAVEALLTWPSKYWMDVQQHLHSFVRIHKQQLQQAFVVS